MPKATPKKIGLRSSGRKTLRFGLVNVGISTAPALDTDARIRGKMSDPDTLTPLKQQYVNEAGDVIPRDEIVTAYPFGDKMVVLEKDEVPKLDNSETIDLVGRMEADEFPIEMVEKTALAWPADETHSDAYALVSHYLRSNGRVFVGETTSNGTTKMLAVRWSNVYGCLVTHELVIHERVRWANIEKLQAGLAEIAEPAAQMQQLAEQLFDAIPDDFAWDEVRDEYGERLANAIREKAESGAVTVPDRTAAPATGPDLLAALQASLGSVTTTDAGVLPMRIEDDDMLKCDGGLVPAKEVFKS